MSSDVTIITRRNRTTILGETTAGKKWMRDNLILSSANILVHIIPADTTEDFIKDLEKAEITYETA